MVMPIVREQRVARRNRNDNNVCDDFMGSAQSVETPYIPPSVRFAHVPSVMDAGADAVTRWITTIENNPA